MQRDVTIEKISYMMDRLGDTEVTAADMEEMITKIFVASFEYEYGFEADVIRALLGARHTLLSYEDDTEDEIPTLDAKEAETWYLECQTKMYLEIGCTASYAEESSSWPDALPLHADWDKKFLRAMARKEVAHHLVVMDQIRAEMEKRDADANS